LNAVKLRLTDSTCGRYRAGNAHFRFGVQKIVSLHPLSLFRASALSLFSNFHAMSFSLLSWSSLFYATIAYCFISYIRSYLDERRFRKFQQEHGCFDRPKRQVSKWPWGIDGLYRVLMSGRRGEDVFDDLIIPRFERVKAWTMESTGLLGQDIITTAEPQNVQAILATNFKDFETGARRRAQFGAMLGYNIFTSDGDFWQHSRALFRPVFNRSNINDLEETERAANILIDVLPAGEGQWTAPVELMSYFYRFTLDTATAFLFGSTVDSQLAAAGRLTSSDKEGLTSLAADQEFVNALAIGQEWLAYRIRVQGLYWMVTSPRWKKAVATVRTFVNKYVDLALDQQQEDLKTEAGEEGKYNLLKELAKETRDPIELRDQLLGILTAGRDTTAILLTWTVIELAHHPDIFKRLREEILSEFGTSSSTSTTLNFSALKSCRYLQWVLNETLRLHPVLPINNRMAVRDTILPIGGGEDQSKPFAIRKGQLVNFIFYQINRRKDLWGEDANEFIPARWDGRKLDWNFTP
jgi:cytochrome P450